MKEETYQKAKLIMDEVENLRMLKKLEYPPECYSIVFATSSGSEVIAKHRDIGHNGVMKMINTFNEIIDDLINKNMEKLEALKE